MNHYKQDYELICDEHKQLCTQDEYIAMRQMVDRHYNTFDKNKELLGRLSNNDFLKEYPMYQLVVDVLNGINKEMDSVDEYTEKFIYQLETDLFKMTDVQEVIERKGKLEFRLVSAEEMEQKGANKMYRTGKLIDGKLYLKTRKGNWINIRYYLDNIS